MKILLVGSGGREHALGVGLHADPSCTELHAAPEIQVSLSLHNVIQLQLQIMLRLLSWQKNYRLT
jgi:phosphoribosylamine-glycine ligase